MHMQKWYPGTGSTFYFTLVIPPCDPAELEMKPIAPKDESQSLAERYPLSILVAEDNAVNQKLALRMLKRLGYDPTICNNGLEAVENVRDKAFDLVLMDMQMVRSVYMFEDVCASF